MAKDDFAQVEVRRPDGNWERVWVSKENYDLIKMAQEDGIVGPAAVATRGWYRLIQPERVILRVNCPGMEPEVGAPVSLLVKGETKTGVLEEWTIEENATTKTHELVITFALVKE